MKLHLLDLSILAVYFAIVILVGILSSRKRSNEGFLIADRSLGPWMDTATIVAAKTGAGVLVTFVALVYLYGISAMWFFAGAATGYLIFIPFAVHLRHLSALQRFYTLSDYFFHRFGVAAGVVSAIVVFLYMVLVLMIQMISGAKILNDLIGISYGFSLLVIAGTIFSYMILGGFAAVVKTDVLQFLAIVILTWLIGYVLWSGSLRSVMDAAFSIGKPAPIKSILSFFLIGILLPFTSAELWQRVYAAKDAKTVRKTLFMTSFFYTLIGVSILIIGLAISARVKNIDPDLALVAGFRNLLPSGLLGIAVVALLAAILSSADSYLFVTVSIVIHDFYSRFRKVEKQKLVRVFRIMLPVFIVLTLALSFRFRSVVAITFYALAFGSIIAVSGMVSWLIRPIQREMIISGIIAGVIGTLFSIIMVASSERLVLRSIGFTIAGLAVGGCFCAFRALVRSRRESVSRWRSPQL